MDLKHWAVRCQGAVASVAVVLALGTIGGCGSTGRDETANWSADKLYSEAKDELQGGNYDRAAKLLEKLEGRAAGTILAQQAQIDRAYALYKNNDKPQAQSVLDRFIKLNPSSPAIDYAVYLQGILNFNDNLGLFGSLSRQDLAERDQQASRDAYQSFRRVVEQYPQSRYAPDAQKRMDYIVNSLAAYEVHVARYYYRRGAFIASANRAQQAIQEFQRSPSVEEALFILTQSYDRLGLETLRDDAQRVLRTNYPKSQFLTADGQGVRGKPWWQIW